MSQITTYKYPDFPPGFRKKGTNLLFHSSYWIEVLRLTYKMDFVLGLDDYSEQFLIFGIVDNPFEKKLISLPFSDYSGEDNLSPETASLIIKSIQKEFPLYNIVFKSRFPSGSVLKYGTHEKSAVYHRIEFYDKDLKQVEESQSSSFKRGVRKAVKKEVFVERTRSENDLKEFYGLYGALRMKKFQIIPQPFTFFENIQKSFFDRNKGFMLKAVFSNKHIASIIVLEHNNAWYYKFGASAKEHLDKRPNNLLFDELIHLAIEKGIDFIDLGMSGAGEDYKGLRKFKEDMGGKEYPISLFNFEALQLEDKEKEDKKILNEFTKLIVSQKPPIKQVSELSEFLYPFFV
ncbi:GNAT family N-acetyltransferase [Autumnicola musiva]|uniref:GNAT family N-acetyltransferase n=1 Tax=Autumnicola musiva TaxID=3075589 RepID=A0ABU3D343_9FLAO|nr:GNAT family N-acetyltransferase [Zunongwangia sp. F117]MDT0675953.1 GNAT family N-acetyltransferase [Zunongwangia sp. F117]